MWQNYGSPAALASGFLLAVTLGNPWPEKTKKLITPLLQIAVIGMGAGMNFETVLRAGANGFIYTVIGILFALFIGEVCLKRWLRTDSDTSFLITVGTAICGGSAIAAVSGVINAKSRDISVALATVFILNSFALILFPVIGHATHLTETQFGLWCALAIHDTSSVVGASMLFGPRALEVATTVKLARALWIVPLTLVTAKGWIRKKPASNSAPIKKPWFIAGFLVMAAIATYVPSFAPHAASVYALSKIMLILTLFLIGAQLSVDTVKKIGIKPLAHGLLLWIIVGSASLLAIVSGWIS